MRLHPFLAILLLVAFASASQAVIYKWVDHQGEAHFADAPDKIPEAYRSQAVDFDQVDAQGSVTYDPNFGKKAPFYKRFLRQINELQEERVEAAAKSPEVILYMTDW